METINMVRIRRVVFKLFLIGALTTSSALALGPKIKYHFLTWTKMRGLRLLFISLLLCVSSIGADWYASVTGSDSGLGTQASPWSLRTALTNNLDAAAINTAVVGGDVIWLSSGTYTGAFTSTLAANSSGCEKINK